MNQGTLLGRLTHSSINVQGSRLIVLVLLLVTLLVATVGCSSAQKSSEAGKGQKQTQERPSAIDVVRLSYKSTTRAESARFDMDSSYEGLNIGQGASATLPADFHINSEGLLDLSGERAGTQTNIPGLGTIEARQIGNVLYERLPAPMLSQMPEGKTWIRMNLDELFRKQYGASFSEFQGGTADSNMDYLKSLRAASGSVENLGREKVRGVQTTHYRAELDLEHAAKADSLKNSGLYKKLKSQIGTGKLQTEVWLDGAGKVRRLEATTPLSLEALPPGVRSKDARATVVQEFYDFGTPVNVQAPSADQVTDMDALPRH